MPLTRRLFVRHATTAAAGLIGAPLLPSSWLAARHSADELLDGAAAPYDDADVRALAMRALDAARAAGAKYADVRINQSRLLLLSMNTGTIPADITFMLPAVSSRVTVGVRVVIDGAWGFAGGSTLTPEGVERFARYAAGFARDGRQRLPTAWEYAAAPVVPDGRWETPIETDPFTIPIAQYLQIYRDGMTEAKKIKEARCGAQVYWSKSDRLFASTEGSMIGQRIYESNPRVMAYSARPGDRRLFGYAEVELPSGGYGYETLAKANLKAEWPRAAQDAVRQAARPFKTAAIGRCDVVLGTRVMAALLRPTSRALELDRALGTKANESGTTFAMPPEDIVGHYQLGSKHVTITGDRSRPRATGTTGWDEEGVKPEEFTLVQDGTVVDFVTTRATAPALAAWYARQSMPVRSHGCAARTGRLQPILQLPNLTLKPGAGTTSLDDLVANIKQGYYVEDAYLSSDQQQLNVQVTASAAYEIVRGKLGAAVVDMGLQFTLPRFWQSLVALGGVGSAKLESISVDQSDPDRLEFVGACTVPALVRQLNVMSDGKEA